MLRCAYLIFLGWFVMTSSTAQAESRVLNLESFATASGDLDWRVVNDNVMGGRSVGDYAIAGGALDFRGRTNTNGGGFSSLRTGPLTLDLSAYSGMRLTVRGDGRRYTWRLTTNVVWRGLPVAYWADFPTQAGRMITVDVPFERFVPRVRGQRLTGPALDTSNISGMGLMIYDGMDGAFALTLSKIVAYSTSNAFSLERLRWSRRVLVLSAPSARDTQLETQLGDVERTQKAFAERDMTLVVLIDDAEPPAAAPTLSASERRELRRQLALTADRFGLRLIGKDGSVKRRADAPVPMLAIYEQIDGMPMRRREMRDRRNES